jgi:hypothetical protein
VYKHLVPEYATTGKPYLYKTLLLCKKKKKRKNLIISETCFIFLRSKGLWFKNLSCTTLKTDVSELDIKEQFVLLRENSPCPLQKPVFQRCGRKEGFVKRTIRNI